MAIYNDYIAAAITYNFQLLPESLICGMIILSIVLVNQPLIVLAAGATGTQVLTSVVGKLIMRYAEGNAQLTGSKCAEVCSPGFLGKSWYRLLNGGRAPELLWHPIAPSVYLATIAFFVGFGLALLQIYKEEIDAKVVSRSTLTMMAIVSLILLAMAVVFRIGNGCDSMFGAVGGVLLGIMLGYLGSIMISYFTNRRATNVWGIPLIRDRINNGSALYVCPRA
jgi:hypothetical protein